MHAPTAKQWHIDIDKYTSSLVPRNPTYRLPRPIAHFLGHRNRPEKEVGNVIVAGWALLGAFVVVIVLAGTYKIPTIQSHAPPIVIGSFGAAAILEFNTIESPLAQPRNSILGNLLSAGIGVGVTKLFKLSSNFEQMRWLAGGAGCGLASAVMTLTKTIYPPAGATALLASVDPLVEGLGWYLLPLVLLSSVLTLVTSLLLNNIQRRYPTYWWTPADVGKNKQGNDIEKAPSDITEVPSSVASSQSDVSKGEESSMLSIRITPEKVVVPDHFYLAAEEEKILEILKDRLRQGLPSSNEKS